MSVILLPQRFLSQPQYPANLAKKEFWRLVDIQGLPPLGTAAASITRTLNGTAKLSAGPAGKCVDFVVAGDWLSYGANPALQLTTMTGLAVVEVPSSPSDISTIFNTNVSGAFARGFVIRVNADGTVFALMQDVIGIGTTTKTVKLGGVSTVAWSYNNISGLLRIAIDGVVESFVYADSSFAHGDVGRNQYYAGSTTQAKAHKQYLFALSAECDKVTNSELIAWSNDPWSIFEAPRRLLPVAEGGSVEVTGSVAYTNIDDASAASADATITASSATTNADDTSASNEATTVTASSSTTNSDDVSEASVTSETEAVTATVAVTNVDDVSAAITAPEISASSGTTNASDISGGLASPVVSASAANTSADDVSVASASAGSEAAGSVAYTNIDDVSASVLVAAIRGSVAYTNFGDISAAVASGYTSSTASYTNADDVVAAFASPVISGALATTNAGDVSDAAAIAEAGEVTATVDTTNADDVSVVICAPVIVGTVAYSNLHDFSAAVGVVNFGTIVEAGLTTGIVESARVKKPGIPANAPQWQKTMFEIMTGRRGNKIDVAAQQNLTFSATPTKEECEALYSYLSEVHKSMNQLINRFDS